MKWLLLTGCFLFLNSTLAQPYLPVLEEDHEWNVAYYDFFSGGIVNVNTYNFIGEEVIDGKVYKILYSDGMITTCRMREENGILYNYDTSVGTESVMIDFNVEIGDELTEGFFCPNAFGGTIEIFRVINITSEFIAGQTRKVIELEGFDDLGNPFDYFEYWVEGIGSLNGLAPYGYNWDFFNLLTCFKQDGTTYFFNDFNTCVPALGVSETFGSKIMLIPNPVTAISTFQIPESVQIDEIRVYDISGRLISGAAVKNKYITLNAADFSSGLYFYQLLTDSHLIKSNKFVVK